MELSLQFEDNKTGHEDLVLRFAGRSWICDSYYLALDQKVLPEREDAYKIRVVLRRLLEQWLFTLENCPDGGSVNLPYDFSDQYTGWLKCERKGVVADLCQGWAGVAGWSLIPTALGQCLTSLPGFRPDGPSIQVTMSDLTQAVGESILAAGSE